jgi:hypothetical protein
MTVLQVAGVGAVVLLASTSIGYAGPCSVEIDSMQTRVDARLEAKAAAGPNAKESTDALTHRQPTPSSIARAEERLREMSAETVAAVKQALGRSRAVDSAVTRMHASRRSQRCNA